MKTLSKEQLKAKADEFFAKNPEIKKAYATSDGNVFISENRAKLHAGKGNVFTFEGEQDLQDEQSKDVLNAKNTIAFIKAATTLEDLKVFEADDRKSVQEALEKKINELSNNL